MEDRRTAPRDVVTPDAFHVDFRVVALASTAPRPQPHPGPDGAVPSEAAP